MYSCKSLYNYEFTALQVVAIIIGVFKRNEMCENCNFDLQARKTYELKNSYKAD